MTRETRFTIANLIQRDTWTIENLLVCAKGWLDVAQATKMEEYKVLTFTYLNKAMEIEAGITISGGVMP